MKICMHAWMQYKYIIYKLNIVSRYVPELYNESAILFYRTQT